MQTPVALHRDPAAIAPLKPGELPAELRNLALDTVAAAARLTGTLHPVTARAIATFLRPANSYHSNLIERHDTHPLDIARAMQQEYSTDTRNRSLQLEALAHIAMHEQLPALLGQPQRQPRRRAPREGAAAGRGLGPAAGSQRGAHSNRPARRPAHLPAPAGPASVGEACCSARTGPGHPHGRTAAVGFGHRTYFDNAHRQTPEALWA